MEKTIVVGGSGFIGNAIQNVVIEQEKEEAFVFSYNRHPEKIQDGLEKTRMNLLEKKDLGLIEKCSRAIYVSGSADHKLAKRSPSLDLDLNVRSFLNFLEKFNGQLVLLSSQAVYYDLNGKISENTEHVSTIPYGVSKQMAEAYAKYFLARGQLSRLWVFRLMYAFGKGEKDRRLVPSCARAVTSKEPVIVLGGGKSYLNPLSSRFVAKILLKADEELGEKGESSLEITNINHPEKVTVGDVAKFLSEVKQFDYTVKDSGEEWPVRFWGDTTRLSSHFRGWNISFPDVWSSLKEYFEILVEGGLNG